MLEQFSKQARGRDGGYNRNRPAQSYKNFTRNRHSEGWEGVHDTKK